MTGRTDPFAGALPPSLAEIIDAIGIGAALKLVEAYGGIRVYVPGEEYIDAEHALVRAVGLEAARRLARARAREFIEVPRAAAYLRAVRNAAIRDGLTEASAAELARRYGTTRRNIFRIKAAEETDDVGERQPRLL